MWKNSTGQNTFKMYCINPWYDLPPRCRILEDNGGTEKFPMLRGWGDWGLIKTSIVPQPPWQHPLISIPVLYLLHPSQPPLLDRSHHQSLHTLYPSLSAIRPYLSFRFSINCSMFTSSRRTKSDFPNSRPSSTAILTDRQNDKKR